MIVVNGCVVSHVTLVTGHVTEGMGISVHCLEKWKGCGLVRGDDGEGEGEICLKEISLARADHCSLQEHSRKCVHRPDY